MIENMTGLGRDATAMIVQVARMYYEQDMTQPAIAERLKVSQSRVSRWLKQASEMGIVRTIVIPPEGVFPDLEAQLVGTYGLRQALVVQTTQDEHGLLAGLGAAAASYLETTLENGARVGFSSWSETLLATVDAMTPLRRRKAESIVQIMGGIGNPEVQVKATQLTHRLARLTGATPSFLPTPGIVASKSARDALYQDPHVRATEREWELLTDVLVGIGSVMPSPLLRVSGNSLGDEDLAKLAALGAIGDVAMRFFDANGAYVESDLDERVIGIGVETLRRIPRRIGVAGGARKVEAIRGAMVGGWIDVLITDLDTAQRLLEAS